MVEDRIDHLTGRGQCQVVQRRGEDGMVHRGRRHTDDYLDRVERVLIEVGHRGHQCVDIAAQATGIRRLDGSLCSSPMSDGVGDHGGL